MVDKVLKRGLILKYLLLIFPRQVFNLFPNLAAVTLKLIALFFIVLLDNLDDVVLETKSLDSLSKVHLLGLAGLH